MEGEIGITPPSAISPFFLRSATPRSCCSFDYEGFSGGKGGGGRTSVTPDSTSPQSITGARVAGDLFELRRQVALRQIQQMADKYDECFQSLKSVFSEIDALRSENLHLADMNLRLSILIGDLEAAASPPLDPAAIGSSSGLELGTTPKSISIRSPGYLAAAGGGGRHRLQLPAMSATTEVSDGEVEVEVYGQGEAKTEMCNNWAKAGTCRYGGRCRFAHGLEELRPVIRHPRYKTQPCRMIGPSGDCPYGHRCHFRHSLPPAASEA